MFGQGVQKKRMTRQMTRQPSIELHASVRLTRQKSPKTADSETEAQSEDQSVATRVRLLPRYQYWVCSIFDLLARSSWMFTLMPSSIVTHDPVLSCIMVSFISSLEV